MLLEKLLEIERAVIGGDFTLVHSLVLEAEDCALKIDRELMRLYELEKLRSSGRHASTRSRRSSLSLRQV
jgi:hypothetical protein